MQIPFVANGNGWSFFLDFKPVTITSDNIRYSEITHALTNGDEAELRRLLALSDEEFLISKVERETESFGQLKFSLVKNGDGTEESSVEYKDRPLAKCLKDKLFSLWRNGCKDFTHYFAFLDKLEQNPSHRAQTELYRFLSYAELPITMEGNFIAYKGLDDKLTSIHGNIETRVLRGERLANGKIKNTIGSIIEVAVSDVDDNCNNYCSCGLHVGSYDYAKSFGQRIVAVEVDPRYVVSIPLDANGQKCRVSQYRVLNEVGGEYSAPDVTTDDAGNVTEIERESRPSEHPGITKLLSADNIANTRAAIDRNIREHGIYSDATGFFVESINYLKTPSINWTPHCTTIAQLCGSVGRKDSIPRAAMLTILLRLGYNVKVNNASLGNSIVY